MKSIVRCLLAPEASGPLTTTALLALRLWLGLTILLNHGWDKLAHFSEKADKFPDVTGLGSAVSLGLAVFAEFFCGALLVLGLMTRFAALMLSITMGVAFAYAHKFKLSGPGSGELAFIYLAGFVTILVAGPGRCSADACLFTRPSAPPAATEGS
jgi:putative oxidoreductase